MDSISLQIFEVFCPPSKGAACEVPSFYNKNALLSRITDHLLDFAEECKEIDEEDDEEEYLSMMHYPISFIVQLFLPPALSGNIDSIFRSVINTAVGDQTVETTLQNIFQKNWKHFRGEEWKF